MKVIFFGTPDFATKSLEKIYNSHHEVLAVVTQPDRLGNRNKLMPPEVKVLAQELGLKVLQYEKVSKEGVEELKKLNADVFVTCAFGQILSREVLTLAKHGVLNVHASLLPKYRGSSPIQASILNGDSMTGVTIMRTEYEVDSGDILLQKEYPINDTITAGELFDNLSSLGASAIVESLDIVERGEAIYTQQDSSKATFCKMIKKSDGEIDWSKSVDDIHNHIRGMYPWPCAFTKINGDVIKIHKACIYNREKCSSIGVVIDSKDKLLVSVKDGIIELLEVQASGKKCMRASDYLRGHRIEVGTKLGE